MAVKVERRERERGIVSLFKQAMILNISDKKANKYQITKTKLGVLGFRFCMGGGMGKKTST